MTARIIYALTLATAMLVAPCSNSAFGQWTNQRTTRGDTVAGGIAGAIIGGIVGNQNDETPEGIAIGAAVGALAGNAIGNSRQQAQRDQYAYQQHMLQRQAVQQQVQQQAFQRAASVQDVISMTQNGIGSAVIANHLRTVGVQQEVIVSDIITLHRAGVDEQVITLMQQLGSGQVAAPQLNRRSYVPVINTAPRVIVEQRYAVPVQVYPVGHAYDSRRQQQWEAQRAYQNHLNFHYRR